MDEWEWKRLEEIINHTLAKVKKTYGQKMSTTILNIYTLELKENIKNGLLLPKFETKSQNQLTKEQKEIIKDRDC